MFCPFNILRYKFGVEYLKRSQKRQIQPAQKYFSPFRLNGIFSQLTPNRLFCLIEIVKKIVVKFLNFSGLLTLKSVTPTLTLAF